MEKIEFIPTTPKPWLKWISVALVIVVFSAAIFFTEDLTLQVRADTPAIDQQVEPTTGIGQDAAIEELNATIEELTLTIAEKDAVIEDQTETIEKKDAVIAEQNDTITTLNTENDTLGQQLEVLSEKYSTEYHVVFEIRRDGIVEEILIANHIVPEHVYQQYQIGTQVSQITPYLSIPNDWVGAEWTVTVQNKYAVDITDT